MARKAKSDVAKSDALPAEGTDAPDLGVLLDPEIVERAAEEERRAIGRFNLVVAGNTGVGKSSLVNAIFGEKLAETGTGRPVTRGVHYYSNPGKSLGIWDFEGFETGGMAPVDLVREHLDEIARGPEIQRAAVAWYCVLGDSHRLTNADEAAIRALSQAGLKVIVVLTKVARVKNRVTGNHTLSEKTQEFVDALRDPEVYDIPVEHVVLTAAEDQGKFGGVRHGLDELLTFTLELTPGDKKDALLVAQRLSLPLKKEMARRVIAAAAAAATTTAAVPIPVADAVALAPIQLGMMGRLSVIYGLDMKTMLSAQAIAQIALQITGKALARGLITLIPGVGSVINASVAAALTTASGEGWRRLCEEVHQGRLPIERIDSVLGDYLPTVTKVVAAMVKSRSGKSA